jgi:hypothetical protein
MGYGYAVTVAGCPQIFMTYGCEVTDWDSADDAPGEAQSVAGTLVDPSWRWDESCDPLSGDLQVGGVSFELEDAPDDDGNPRITYLGNRDESSIPSTSLAASIDENDLTLTVADGAALGSFPQVLWIDGEALLCDSISTNTVTVNAAGRGYYGSLATSHLVDAANNVMPEVFAAFPWFDYRRVVLWRVEAGVAKPLWRGRIEDKPESSGGGDAVGPARYSFRCEHAWTFQRNQPLGVPEAVCRLRGFHVRGIDLRISLGQAGTGFSSERYAYEKRVEKIYDTLKEALSASKSNLYQHMGSYQSFANLGEPVVERSGIRWTVTTTFNTGNGALDISQRVAEQTASAAATQQTGTYKIAEVATDGVPDALVYCPSGMGVYPIDRTEGLPSDWTAQEHDEGASHRTLIDPVLRGDYSDAHAFELTPRSATDSADPVVDTNNAEAGGPTFRGTGKFLPRTPYGREHTAEYIATANFLLRLTARVESSHFAYGIRRALEDTTFTRSGVDTRDWGWDGLQDVVDETTDRTWAPCRFYLDGSMAVQDVVTNRCALAGAGVAVGDGGKLGLISYAPPTFQTPVVATLTEADILGYPSFGRLDGTRNAARLQGELVDLLVRDAHSIGRYRQTYEGSLRLVGLKFDAAASDNPTALASSVLSRYLSLWSRPRQTVTFTLPLAEWHETAVHGAWFYLTMWLVPNASGGRGVTDLFAKVIRRAVDVARGELTVTCLTYNAVHGYAPCIRVASIAGATVTADVNYIQTDSGTDYSGSDQSGYVGTPSDGGVSLFQTGMVCEIVKRDVTTYTAETGLVIQSVNPGSRQITFTSSPTTAPAAGEIWDLRFAAWNASGVTAAQKAYAYVGSRSAGVIAGTTTKNKAWAP